MILTTRRRFLELAICQIIVLGSVGCGTVLHPERRGQPAGPLDWSIVALDAVGLLLFFVPGVIAFAVDFSNGTIYLPPDRLGSKSASSDDRKLVTVRVPAEQITVQKVEHVVSEHTEREIHLRPGTFQSQALNTIDEFWATVDKYLSVEVRQTS